MKLIVFSDLDGTLLDHHSYDHTPAAPALARIREEGWPLVFVTSKTRAEVEALRAELDLHDPFIVENGGGIFFPQACVQLAPEGSESDGTMTRLTLGCSYPEIRAFVEGPGRSLGIRGFGDMSAEEVARVTGLGSEAAAMAKRRDFTEPFLLEEGHTLEAVHEAAALHGLRTTTGGRFHHLMGEQQDKGRAVKLVHERYESVQGHEYVTIGLGDGRNDLPMLRVVTHAVVVPAPGRPPLALDRPHRVAPFEGPAGWNQALLEIFEVLDPD